MRGFKRSINIIPNIKTVSICKWCKKEMVNKRGKYHTWCSETVREIKFNAYKKKYRAKKSQ